MAGRNVPKKRKKTHTRCPNVINLEPLSRGTFPPSEGTWQHELFDCIQAVSERREDSTVHLSCLQEDTCLLLDASRAGGQ